MQIVIPMAGTGARFMAAGYKDPKPLIRIGIEGRRIIEHVLDMFQDIGDEFIFICNVDHLNTTDMREVLESLKPGCRVVSMPAHKKGPVFTLLPALPFIRDEAEVIVSYCDGTLKWDRTDFVEAVQHMDGCLFTHTGFHPHTLSTTKMAFLKERNGRVLEVKEKASYTDDPWSEHASSGVYYFRRGSFIKQYAKQLIERDLNYGGEFYVTLLYNLLIQDGLNVGFYDTDYVAILGTPEDVRNFEAWQWLTKNAQIRRDVDIIDCFRYWQKYHKIK